MRCRYEGAPVPSRLESRSQMPDTSLAVTIARLEEGIVTWCSSAPPLATPPDKWSGYEGIVDLLAGKWSSDGIMLPTSGTKKLFLAC